MSYCCAFHGHDHGVISNYLGHYKYNVTDVRLGCGVNVSNSEPSDCINDVITRYNRRHGTSLAHVTLEQVLARSVVLLEGFLETLAEAGSFEPLLDTYYKRWLHTCVPFFHIY